LKELAAKARIKKRITPHALRHARATHLAKILTEAQMKEFFGWTQSSEMAAVYVHLSGRDVDAALLSAYGRKESEESDKPRLHPVVCPRCRKENSPGVTFCECGMPLGESFMVEEDSLEKRIARLEEQMKVLNEVRRLLEDIKAVKTIVEAVREKD